MNWRDVSIWCAYANALRRSVGTVEFWRETKQKTRRKTSFNDVISSSKWACYLRPHFFFLLKSVIISFWRSFYLVSRSQCWHWRCRKSEKKQQQTYQKFHIILGGNTICHIFHSDVYTQRRRHTKNDANVTFCLVKMEKGLAKFGQKIIMSDDFAKVVHWMCVCVCTNTRKQNTLKTPNIKRS